MYCSQNVRQCSPKVGQSAGSEGCGSATMHPRVALSAMYCLAANSCLHRWKISADARSGWSYCMFQVVDEAQRAVVFHQTARAQACISLVVLSYIVTEQRLFAHRIDSIERVSLYTHDWDGLGASDSDRRLVEAERIHQISDGEKVGVSKRMSVMSLRTRRFLSHSGTPQACLAPH